MYTNNQKIFFKICLVTRVSNAKKLRSGIIFPLYFFNMKIKDKILIVVYEGQGHLNVPESKVILQSQQQIFHGDSYSLHCRLFCSHFDIVFEVQWCLFVGPSSPLGGAETGTVGWESPRVRNWWASSVLFPLSSRCMTSKSLSITRINNWMFELQNWTFKMYNTWK